MRVSNFMEESYKIGDPRVPKVLGNWGPGVPFLGVRISPVARVNMAHMGVTTPWGGKVGGGGGGKT